MLILPPEVADLIASGAAEKRVLFRVDFDDGPEGLWNGDYPLTVAGVLYHPLGGNIDLGDIQSSIEMDADVVDVVLAGLLQSAAVMFEGGDWHQRPAVISIGILNAAGEVIHTVPRVSGFLDEAPSSSAADEPLTVIGKVETNNRALNRESTQTRSDAGHRIVPGASEDGFYKYCNAAAVVEPNIPWGRKGEQYPVRPR